LLRLPDIKAGDTNIPVFGEMSLGTELIFSSYAVDTQLSFTYPERYPKLRSLKLRANKLRHRVAALVIYFRSGK
jgi:hypothetical protein